MSGPNATQQLPQEKLAEDLDALDEAMVDLNGTIQEVLALLTVELPMQGIVVQTSFSRPPGGKK